MRLLLYSRFIFQSLISVFIQEILVGSLIEFLTGTPKYSTEMDELLHFMFLSIRSNLLNKFFVTCFLQKRVYHVILDYLISNDLFKLVDFVLIYQLNLSY